MPVNDYSPMSDNDMCLMQPPAYRHGYSQHWFKPVRVSVGEKCICAFRFMVTLAPSSGWALARTHWAAR